MSTAARVLATPGLDSFVERVERRLERLVAGSGVVAEAGGATLRSGGKRLRPALVYLAAPAPVRDCDQLVASGCAVELVHMATLVHDDQLDAAPLRRGHPTVWRLHGPRVATATGDHLFARAFGELVATASMPAVATLAGACLGLARGEIRQREQAGDPATTPEHYLERCRLKTGRLFAAAVTLGGVFAGLERPSLERLGEFGELLGLAFQIADDVLDCDGQPDTTGKPLGTDLLDGTVTLPLLLAAERDPVVAQVIARGAEPADVLPTLARVARCGAVRDAREQAHEHAAAAIDRLTGLDPTIDTAALAEVARGVVERRA